MASNKNLFSMEQMKLWKSNWFCDYSIEHLNQVSLLPIAFRIGIYSNLFFIHFSINPFFCKRLFYNMKQSMNLVEQKKKTCPFLIKYFVLFPQGMKKRNLWIWIITLFLKRTNPVNGDIKSILSASRDVHAMNVVNTILSYEKISVIGLILFRWGSRISKNVTTKSQTKNHKLNFVP